MTRSHVFGATTAMFLVSVAPGMLLSSYASQGSALGQKKATEAEMAYRAYGAGINNFGQSYQVMPDSYFVQRKKGQSMYEAPRGGREY